MAADGAVRHERKAHMPLTHVGLFEGYGGTRMAAAAALGPLDTLWCSDIKPASIALLAHHHPGLLNVGDIAALFPARGPLTCEAVSLARPDVATFSWPCQPFSPAGRRLGEADPRALWPNVLRYITEARPTILLGENVARIAGNGELRRVVGSLAERGYVGAWWCVNASDVGAPHKRSRCFLVAVDAAAPDALGILVRNQSGRGGGTDGTGAGVAGHDGAQGSAELALFPTPGADPRRSRLPSAEVGQARLDSGRRNLEDAVAARLLPTPTQNMTTGAGTSGRDGGLNLQTAVNLLPTPTARDAKDRGNFTEQADRRRSLPHRIKAMEDADRGRWGIYAEAVTLWERELGRPAPDPTIPSPRNGSPQLSPAFVEWMMGVPAGWVSEAPVARPSSLRNARLSLLGDGVVPQQGAYAYRFLLDHLTERLIADSLVA